MGQIKLKSGYLYLIDPYDSPLYAVAPSRIWWKPWRWKLKLMRLYQIDEEIYNLSEQETVGIMKLYHVKNFT